MPGAWRCEPSPLYANMCSYMVICVLFSRFALVAALDGRRELMGEPVALAPEGGGRQGGGGGAGGAGARGGAQAGGGGGVARGRGVRRGAWDAGRGSARPLPRAAARA